jgi:hypothetical protein
MLSSTLKRSVGTLAIVAGLLAAAVPASAQGGGAVVAMGGQGDRAVFTRLQGQVPQRGLILNGTGDDQMVTAAQQGQVAQQDRVITMLDYEGTPVTTDSPKDSPQAYMTDVIWQGYANPADSNEVAVEGITLAHEGFEIQALGRRSGGEVISSDAY